MPIGATIPYAGGAAPSGWLLCNGQTVSRTTYAALFAVLGSGASPYGLGDGSTTFTLPDLRDRTPVGASGTKAVGSTGGAATVNLQHSHGITASAGASASGTDGYGGGAGVLNTAGHTHPVTASSDNQLSTAQSVQNPYQALNYIIYAGV